MRRPLVLGAVLVALVLAGCGVGGGDGGTATLWVTRDRGGETMVRTTVPSGQTLMRALRAEAKVDTRYGGRYVQAIDGVEGDIGKRHDWFWFVNGYAGDTSAAELRLRAGDVAWWDYRDWTHDAEDVLVVAGAFPEPFVHGFGGKVRPAAVRYATGRAADARRVAKVIGADDVKPAGAPVPAQDNVFELVDGTGPRLAASLRSPGAGAGTPVRFTYAGAVGPLLDGAYARRFEVP